MKIDEISKLELPNLFGKFLVVETISDGYTGTVSGHYNYEIDQNLRKLIFTLYFGMISLTNLLGQMN